MIRTIEEQARDLAHKALEEYSDCYPTDNMSRLESDLRQALRAAKVDGMEEAANLVKNTEATTVYAEDIRFRLWKEIRAAAQKVREGK